jgi:Zn-dependent M28 family amino/carboxypeptidase
VRRPEALARAVEWLQSELSAEGYEPVRQTFAVDGVPCHNLEVQLPGGARDDELIVIGAHYDSADDTAGANDNGSGVAALLALARRMHGRPFARSVRFVWFTNEEPPHFQTADMGSMRYAYRARKQGARIAAMLSLETMGYYSDRPQSQKYPLPLSLFYPDRGDFIAFVANTESRALLHSAVTAFRAHARFPSEGAALSASTPGVG